MVPVPITGTMMSTVRLEFTCNKQHSPGFYKRFANWKQICCRMRFFAGGPRDAPHGSVVKQGQVVPVEVCDERAAQRAAANSTVAYSRAIKALRMNTTPRAKWRLELLARWTAKKTLGDFEILELMHNKLCATNSRRINACCVKDLCLIKRLPPPRALGVD